jgi:basic amino acid/polyamine antiporter, APA family
VLTGIAYTFSYASLGELIAWTIGWDLVLEFALGSAAVALGFVVYFLYGYRNSRFARGDGQERPAARRR